MTSTAAVSSFRPSQALWILSAATFGFALALVDTSPNWDDTGISAGVLAILCAIFGAFAPMPAWVSALAIGAWIPVLNIYKTGNTSSLMVLPIALVVAYLARRVRAVLLK